jgi:hypothetical protein
MIIIKYDLFDIEIYYYIEDKFVHQSTLHLR